jgi:predicted phosphodiesterase
MRIAVISDIHGNALALQTVIDDLAQHSCDRIVCLGDAIQGGAQPAETVKLLRELGCPVVMGNADDWLLTGKGEEEDTVEQIAVREWSLSQLSDDDRAFIAQFSPTVTVDLPGGRQLLAFHGSPSSYDDVIWPGAPDDVVAEYLGPYAGSILCGGHTHWQQMRPVGPYFFFNPGSVGLSPAAESAATRVNPWAEYAILTAEDGTLSLEFRRVPFDVERLAAIIRASGRPYAEKAAADFTASIPPSTET